MSSAIKIKEFLEETLEQTFPIENNGINMNILFYRWLMLIIVRWWSNGASMGKTDGKTIDSQQ